MYPFCAFAAFPRSKRVAECCLCEVIAKSNNPLFNPLPPLFSEGGKKEEKLFFRMQYHL